LTYIQCNCRPFWWRESGLGKIDVITNLIADCAGRYLLPQLTSEMFVLELILLTLTVHLPGAKQLPVSYAPESGKTRYQFTSR